MAKIIAFFLSLVAFLTNLFFPKSANISPQNQINSTEPAFYIIEDQTTTNTFNIVLNASGKELSVVALRLEIQSSPSFTVSDQNLQADGVQIEVDKTLAVSGWTFPVNKVFTGNDKTLVDLAAVYINPSGHLAKEPLHLGKISFKNSQKNQTVVFGFDPSLTKAIDKNAKEINTQFTKSTFTLK